MFIEERGKKCVKAGGDECCEENKVGYGNL
jgi:hypothetical protein